MKILIITFFLWCNFSTASTTGSELIGGSFELQNSEGEIFRDTELKGKYFFVFFGFTKCKGVCPLGVRKMMSLHRKLGKHQKKIVPIFITVDPKTDGLKRLKDFKSRYGKDLLTLRGTKKQTDEVVTKFRSYYSKTNNKAIDHSPIIYFMGKSGEYLFHFTSSEQSKILIAKINNIITANVNAFE